MLYIILVILLAMRVIVQIKLFRMQTHKAQFHQLGLIRIRGYCLLLYCVVDYRTLQNGKHTKLWMI